MGQIMRRVLHGDPDGSIDEVREVKPEIHASHRPRSEPDSSWLWCELCNRGVWSPSGVSMSGASPCEFQSQGEI